MNDMIERTVFFISDGTGITAETLGNSLLAQFEHIHFKHVVLPYIDSEEKARDAVNQINHSYINTAEQPIVFDTIVDRNIRQILANSKGFMVDIFSTFLQPLESALNTHSSYRVGKSHSINNHKKYSERMEAVQFTLDNDDGARTRHYDQADIIMIGVSRCGKTPTCLYLALQYGIRAANYPLTEEDLDEAVLPPVLKAHKNKLFGLTIDPDRLAAIRHERKPNSRYASARQCEEEVRGAESLYNKENIPFLNSTHLSVEEISTRLIALLGIERDD